MKLTTVQSKILFAVQKKPAESVLSLADQIGVTDRAIRNCLAGLEEAGLVVVDRSRPRRGLQIRPGVGRLNVLPKRRGRKRAAPPLAIQARMARRRMNPVKLAAHRDDKGYSES